MLELEQYLDQRHTVKNLEEFSLNELSFYISFSLFIELYQLNRKIRIFNLDNPDLTLAYLKDTSDI